MKNKTLPISSHSEEYKSWIIELKQKIRRCQIKAAIKVNTELLKLYWQMGKDINEKSLVAKWGAGFFDKLSRDLKTEFPDMTGFSVTNLKYIKRFYMFYSQSDIIRQQLVDEFRQQLADEIELPIFNIPWSHHIYIISKCKTIKEALFYVNQTIENGWSRSVLEHNIDSELYKRKNNAISNFSKALPDTQSDLANQILKDPYNFDFLTMTRDYCEKELEDALIHNITNFLVELGKGFAYVGKQVPLEVGGKTFFPDLLFYHLELRCFIVVELKTKDFDPSFLGQLNFYVSAINHVMKKECDSPTIGLLICKTKNNVIAQYALESSNSPIGISEYELSKFIPDNFKSSLPTIQEIEENLAE